MRNILRYSGKRKIDQNSPKECCQITQRIKNIIQRFSGFTAVLTGAILVALIRDDGYDFFWYLGAGNLLHKTGHVGNAFTAEGLPWQNHEWLFHWIMALSLEPSIFHLAVKIILVTGILLAVYLVCLRRTKGQIWLSAFTAIISGMLIGEFSALRAYLGSYLLFVVTWGILTSGMPNGRKSAWLAIVMLIWANIHAGFVLGVALIIWHQGFHFLKSKLSREKPESLWWLPVSVALVVPVINPYGIIVYVYPLKWTGNSIYKEYIREWTSIVKWSFHLYPYFAFTAIAIPIVWATKKYRNLVEFIPLVIFAIVPFFAVRHLAFYYMFAAPILAQGVSELETRLAVKSEASIITGNFKWVALIIIVFIIRGSSFYYHPILRTSDPVYQKYVFPTGAIAFMRENNFRGNILNAYQWGGYLWWDGWDIFIDGRLDTLYPESVFLDYTNIANAKPEDIELLDKWNVNYIVYDTKLKETTPKLNAAIIRNPNWMILYQDPVATLFARTNALTPEFLEKFRRRDIAIPDDPMCQYATGMSLLIRDGSPEDIEKYLKRAIELDPVFAQPHLGLARAYIYEKKYSEAKLEIQKAKRLGLRNNTVDDLWDIVKNASNNSQ